MSGPSCSSRQCYKIPKRTRESVVIVLHSLENSVRQLECGHALPSALDRAERAGTGHNVDVVLEHPENAVIILRNLKSACEFVNYLEH
jgi:hypothetical protein